MAASHELVAAQGLRRALRGSSAKGERRHRRWKRKDLRLNLSSAGFRSQVIGSGDSAYDASSAVWFRQILKQVPGSE